MNMMINYSMSLIYYRIMSYIIDYLLSWCLLLYIDCYVWEVLIIFYYWYKIEISSIVGMSVMIVNEICVKNYYIMSK